MVHVRFDPYSITTEQFLQVGYGISGEYTTTYFKGLPPYQRGFGYPQRGAGLGDILRGIWRFLLPVIQSPVVKEIGQTVGKEALQTGSRILTKMAEGGPIKSAVFEEGKNAAESLLEKSLEGVKKSRQSGSGLYIKRGRKRAKVTSPLHVTTIPPRSIKSKRRQRSDAFGFY